MGGTPAATVRPPARVVGRRRSGHRALRAEQPGAEVPVHLRPPHARVRHDQRAAGPGQGGAQPRTRPTTRRPTTRPASPSTTCSNSRWIVKPACHLLDCCVETDNATCIIVTSADRARHLRQRPIYIMSVAGRVNKPFPAMPLPVRLRSPARPGTTPSASSSAMPGVEPEDIQLTGCYDAFTFTPVLLFEGYGFCPVGRGRRVRVERGHRARRGAAQQHQWRPAVRGLYPRHEHGDRERPPTAPPGRRLLPGVAEGEHTYDYSEGGCRQVRDVELAMNMGWGTPSLTSSLILRR